MQVKAGFPPKDVSGSEAELVVQIGITSGSALTVLESKAVPPVAPVAAETSVRYDPAAAAATAAMLYPHAAAPIPTANSPPQPSIAFAEAVDGPPSPPQQHVSSAAIVQSLVDMGFPEEYAASALDAADGDIHIALEMCMEGDPAAFMSDAGLRGGGIAGKSFDFYLGLGGFAQLLS